MKMLGVSVLYRVGAMVIIPTAEVIAWTWTRWEDRQDRRRDRLMGPGYSYPA